MPDISFGLIIIIGTALFSYSAFNNQNLFSKYLFNTEAILNYKQYYRMVTSGFLHGSTSHLIFNMLSLYFFYTGVEQALGPIQFTLVYFGSLIGGNLVSLYLNRHNTGYSAVGASGAVSGVIFASIALFPGMSIYVMFIPIPIPGWVYGIAYILYSIYGMKAQRDNIGHEAHIGGGISGILLVLALVPEILEYNFMPVIMLLIPSVVFIFIMFFNPNFKIGEKVFQQKSNNYTIDDHHNTKKQEKKAAIDRLLEKVKVSGLESLSKTEKDELEQLSKEI